MDENGISVVMTTYDDPINFVDECLNSLLPQDRVYEITIVDSSKKNEIKNLCNYLHHDKIKYVYTPPRGMSDARNKGIEMSKNNIVAFTDSDCIVDKNWAENICKSFTENVAIVGGKVLPRWISRPNKILLNSAIAQGFYSLFDMGDKPKEVIQIFGGNFAINKDLIKDQFFLHELGRRKENLLCGEEIMLCKQIRENGLKIIYNPLTIVWHQIPEERSRFKWMWKRIYYGGVTRAMVGGMPTPKVVDFVSYNFYDIVFLTIFIIPYMLGIISGLRKNMI